jgi:hypothetical protein
MLDEDAVLEELMGNLGEASGRIRASRRLLLEHALARPRIPAAGGAAIRSARGDGNGLQGGPPPSRRRPASNFALRGFSEVRLLEIPGNARARG